MCLENTQKISFHNKLDLNQQKEDIINGEINKTNCKVFSSRVVDYKFLKKKGK